MKSPLCLAAFTFMAVFVLSPIAASAKGKGMQKPKPTPVPEKVNASGGKIAAVAGDTIAVQYSKTTQTFKMTRETNITLNGQRVGSGALKAGMHVEVDPSKIDPGLALSIQAYPASRK